MLKNIRRSRVEEQVSYELTFDNGEGTDGYAFPCDPAGDVIEDTEEGRKSLECCLGHPEKYTRFNEVVRQTRHVRIPTKGTCICGRNVELYDQYRGAFQCGCGRWYDAQDGRELIAPEYWHDED